MSRTDIPKLVPGAELCHRAGCIMEVGHDGSCVDNAGRVLLSKRSPGYSQPRRTPEAQADIGAARAVPTGDGWAGELAEQLDARTNGPPLDTALSNAAIADTPAVREMGGPARSEVDAEISARAHDPRRPTDALLDGRPCVKCGLPTSRGLEAWAAIHAACLTPSTMPPPGCVLLTGPEAERYRAIVAAARKAQASAATARADGAALLQLFQAFCGEVAKSDQERDLARGAKTRPANLDKEP